MLLNYTTTIAPEKSAAQIQEMLRKARATAILSEYDTSQRLVAVSFRVQTADGVVAFQMPANIDGVFAVLRRSKVATRYKTIEHASRVAWRIQKDWVEAQLAKVECGMSDMAEVFMPYLITKGGVRMFDRFREGQFKALGYSGDST